MLRFTKQICGLVLLALSVHSVSAFSLLGPFNEAYQVPVITYQVGGDLGGPKNLGEEYRRNTPVMYYTFDANFLDYFGSNGVYAVEQAFAMMNALDNVSSYSSDLSEFPLEGQSHNYQADALELLDLKSVTLLLLMEQMGLAESDRYTWTLHDREPGPACPATAIYTVIKRNFDPVFTLTDQLQPTSYVNGVLYSYFIQEFCTGTPFLADAVEVTSDPLASVFTPVASGFTLYGPGLDLGGYYNSLTRDDIGGLRYLLRSSNMNVESPGINTLTAGTNFNTFELLFTSNLTLLVNQSLTNNAAQLQALYPGLVISSTRPIFTNVVSTNVFFVLTNYYNGPAGVFYVLPQTVITTNVATWFSHTFANVVTNSYYTSGVITITENGFTAPPNGPAGVFYPTTTSRSVTTNFINGDYFILPTNSQCGVSIVSTQLTFVTTLTNSLVATNAAGQTNINGQQFSQELIFYFTNRVYVINPVPCLDGTNAVALRQGIERVRFVRRDYDSLLNRVFHPITNHYTLNAITNNTLMPQHVQRVVAIPDILITAQDLSSDPSDNVITAPAVARNLNFNTNAVQGAYPGLAGPGTIETPTAFIFQKVGPIYLNPGFFFQNPVVPYDEVTHSLFRLYGSFDGTTNAPVVYPNGTDIRNLENLVLLQVGPVGPNLPAGVLGINYATLFSGFTIGGGTPPFSWSQPAGTPALPDGLTLNPTTGTITGVPTARGVYDITIRVTEEIGSRFVDRNFTLTINPFEASPAGPELPNGTIGSNYADAFSGFAVVGNQGIAPFHWTLAPGSTGLPDGLSLNSSNGKITGAPTTQGVYNFTVRLSDSGSDFVDHSYTITITP